MQCTTEHSIVSLMAHAHAEYLHALAHARDDGHVQAPAEVESPAVLLDEWAAEARQFPTVQEWVSHGSRPAIGVQMSKVGAGSTGNPMSRK